MAEACVFNLSQIGELSNKVDEEFEEQNPQIPWRQLYGLRNRIVHDYEGVNLNILSQVNAAKSALNKVGKVILEWHIKHCVRDGIENGNADKTIENFTKAVERFANMQ